MAVAAVRERAGLNDEQAKWMISTASERESWLEIQVTNSFGKEIHPMTERIRNTSPGRFIRTSDGRVGFNVDGKSFMTTNSNSGRKFLEWLEEAHVMASQKAEYGQPPLSCTFRRCG